MSVILKTAEEALAYLVVLDEQPGADPDVKFEGDLGKIEIDIVGTRYDSSIPGELARSLWEYQEAIYKAGAYVLTGTDDIRRLTSTQRANLELIFTIEHGSTDIQALLETAIGTFGDGFTQMDDQHKAMVLISIAIILATGFVAWKVIDAVKNVRVERIKADLSIATEAEKTKQFGVFERVSSTPKLQRIERAAEEGAKAILRGASDAEEVTIGRAKFDGDDLGAIKQRAIRVASTAEVVEESFRVFGTETRTSGATKYILARGDGTEFAVTVNDEDFTPEELQRIWTAARERNEIRLEVSLIKNRDSVKSAVVNAVL